MASRMCVLLGRNVCKWRVKRGMTHEALAAKLGMDRTCLNRIESGKARPSPEIIVGLQLALSASCDEFSARS